MKTVTVGLSNGEVTLTPDPVTVVGNSGSETIRFQIPANVTNLKIKSFQLGQSYNPVPFTWSNPNPPAGQLDVVDNVGDQGTYSYTLTVRTTGSNGQDYTSRPKQITNGSGELPFDIAGMGRDKPIET